MLLYDDLCNKLETALKFRRGTL
ncbi:hypothetical protein NGA_0441200 [Nannochloropsis gaditana CCMP526]|nr:hypothetical protein NGA_0441200 [Nannochloropsis gaditana CCMP526]EKU22875.1 hypothetical protein NGA_0441200 [Nannochloropsis gaditana CCMP526]|eukprot:XP_005853487.1 hypothetical protein NGA_0441200 [Nannochloropsis gaditana CCMP526]